jgi:hypothetical protein
MPGHERSELLALLNANKAWELPEYRLPVLSDEYLSRAREAIACVASMEDSDPFARDRTALYLRQGYCLPSNVLKDCRSRQGIRQHERNGSPLAEVLAPIKRQVDADRAWNQHNHTMYKEAA